VRVRSADSKVAVRDVGNELHVRINPLSALRRTQAIAALCADLNSTNTVYPGTELVLRYSVKDA
jgi:hypothetical protein